MSVHCPTCDAENPASGRFCVECGAPMQSATTGATVQLPNANDLKSCSSCGAQNPSFASFCVNCGRALAGGSGQATRQRPQTVLPPVAEPMVALPRAPRLPKVDVARWGSVSAGLFLLGLAVLAMTGWWWPGILVLVGLMVLAGTIISGQREGLIGVFWMFGIALLAATDWWWPGILVLVGISVILGGMARQGKLRL